jgi:hypothetical protein
MPPGELWPSIPPTYIVRLASMPAGCSKPGTVQGACCPAWPCDHPSRGLPGIRVAVYSRTLVTLKGE